MILYKYNPFEGFGLSVRGFFGRKCERFFHSLIFNFFFNSSIPSTTAFTRCVPIVSAHFWISSISLGDILNPIFLVLGFWVGLPIFLPLSLITITSFLDYRSKTWYNIKERTAASPPNLLRFLPCLFIK